MVQDVSNDPEFVETFGILVQQPVETDETALLTLLYTTVHQENKEMCFQPSDALALATSLVETLGALYPQLDDLFQRCIAERLEKTYHFTPSQIEKALSLIQK